VARWRGVRLATVLRRAGLTPAAVDVLPAYEMNGQPLPPDHGYRVRVVVPSWIGVHSIKWVGRIEVSATPLSSPWNIGLYRMFGPGHPADGTPVTHQG
jgi:DMSO/TMAO reductase YedYZ molybdopterin-dependent catalytic subunit